MRYQNPRSKIPPFKVEISEVAQMSEVIDWGLKILGIDALHKQGYTGKGVKIAVLDTGIDANHPDLKGQAIAAKSFIPNEDVYDGNGHGTHCAGIIAASANATGVRGVAPDAKLIIAKVLRNNGYGSLNTIVSGGDWAITEGAQIISLSLGSSSPSREVQEAIKRWIDKGVFVIVAAGNEGKEGVSYPGREPMCVTVGAYTGDGEVADFSSIGPTVDIIAPGHGIYSTYPKNRYARLSGTSMATPFVAGVVALLLQKDGGKTIQNQTDLEYALKNSAIDIGKDGFDINSGYGLINPKHLLIDDNKEAEPEKMSDKDYLLLLADAPALLRKIAKKL